MKKIIIYSGNSCTNCTAAKEYIKEKGYDYEEKMFLSIKKQKGVNRHGLHGGSGNHD